MSGGLLGSAQSLLDRVLALGRTRLELFGMELQEALTRAFVAVVGAVAVLLLVALAAAFSALALVIAVAEQYRAPAALLVAAAFLLAALAAALSLRRVWRGEPHAFAVSIDELERDRRALQS